MQKRNLAVVDTNVLIYDFLENSPFHKASRELLNSLDKIILLPNILVEFILVSLRLKIDENIIRNKVEEILKNSILVRIKKEDVIGAINLNIKEVNDALLVIVAKRLDLPIISYDEDVIKACKNLGIKIITL